MYWGTITYTLGSLRTESDRTSGKLDSEVSNRIAFRQHSILYQAPAFPTTQNNASIVSSHLIDY